MKYNPTYKRGSEWRKWDLQIHTPFSYLNNGFGADWDTYVKNLFTKAIEHGIASIGITDYFTIDGYKKLRTDYLDVPAKMDELFTADETAKINSILILPNVEFRLNKLVGANRINFHVIFSNEVPTTDIEENFLHELDFVYEAGPQTEDEKRKLKVANLEALGQKLINEHAEFAGDSPIFVGMKSAVVDDSQISSILANKRNLFEGKYLLALPSDEDLSNVSWNGQDHQARKVLIQKSDLLIAGNPNTVAWALGEKHETHESFVSEFKSLKPCISGSDAHNNDELFIKNPQRLTWIKADPTFEGLRQITFEPAERVEIRELIPDDKPGYQVIESFDMDHSDLGKTSVVLNENLTSVIGGRSTGKSILLAALARKLGSDRDAKRSEKYNEYVAGIASTLSVTWKDGEEGQIRDIEYFPQNFVHELAESEENLNALIQQILKHKGKNQILDTYTRFCDENEGKIRDGISRLFRIRQAAVDKTSQISETGDRKGINDEISRLEKELSDLQQATLMSEEELKTFDEIQGEIRDAEKRIGAIDTDIGYLGFLDQKRLVFDTVNLATSNLSPETLKRVSEEFERLQNEFETNWRAALASLVAELGDEKTKTSSAIATSKSKSEYSKGLDAYTRNAAFEELSKRLSREKGRLKDIDVLQIELDTLEKERKALETELIDLHKKFHTEAEKATTDLSVSYDGLEISAKKNFRNDDYRSLLEDSISLHSHAAKDLANFVFTTNDEYEQHVFGIFQRLLDGSITLKNSYTSNSLIQALIAGNFYSLGFEVLFDGDNFDKMSEGKRAFVVLKLLLDFSDKKCPILIDQPEDDLDNRAIFRDLVAYLKKKKKERQIIVVTHNPNIVVGADSELVIVANQHGVNNENADSLKFKYVSGSLEHNFAVDETIKCTLSKQGIREHVCEILEGGNDAFKKRESRYSIPR